MVTHGIKHWGLSGYSNNLPRIKFGVTRQVSSPQFPTISYCNPLSASANNPSLMPESISYEKPSQYYINSNLLRYCSNYLRII